MVGGDTEERKEEMERDRRGVEKEAEAGRGKRDKGINRASHVRKGRDKETEDKTDLGADTSSDKKKDTYVMTERGENSSHLPYFIITLIKIVTYEKKRIHRRC